MRPQRLMGILTATLFLAVTGTMVGSAMSNQAASSYNLLVNPDFEEGYSYRPDPYTPEQGPRGELEVADGWELWYDNRDQCRDDLCCYNFRPEYKLEDGYVHTDPLRVRSGQYAQKMFTLFATHTAGLYQRVAVPEGTELEFSIWVVVWSSSEDDPYHSTLDGRYWLSVGIDPYGGINDRSEQIVWSDPIEHYDEYVQLSVATTAQADHVTVFTKAAPVYCVKHNDSYWDDARLTIGLPFRAFLPLISKYPTATPTATSTETPTSMPSSTPTPTHTPMDTPAATATTTPTDTPTDTPTATPTPTTTPTILLPDLSTSSKTADRDTIDYCQPVYFTIELHNSGPSVATSVRITDAVPSLLTYFPGTLSGDAVYDSETNTITWAGSLAVGETHTISFGCSGPVPPIPHDTLITNEVVIDDGAHPPFTRSVTIIGNPWPTATPTITATPTQTPTPTSTPTNTPTPTVTSTPTATPTSPPSNFSGDYTVSFTKVSDDPPGCAVLLPGEMTNTYEVIHDPETGAVTLITGEDEFSATLDEDDCTEASDCLTDSAEGFCSLHGCTGTLAVCFTEGDPTLVGGTATIALHGPAGELCEGLVYCTVFCDVNGQRTSGE